MASSIRLISSSLIGARFGLPPGEQSRDRLGEFFAHLLGAVADMLQRAVELAAADRRQPRQQETVAHAPITA